MLYRFMNSLYSFLAFGRIVGLCPKYLLLPANILAILPLLLVTKTSLSSQTMKSSAAMREENDENGSNSSLLAKVSFE
uniref:Uncharacterized protein At1g04910 n=1 Tax=Rhizophora mucronata TaxID=61149 RepID=A0A2P2NFF4_RHIMU